MPCYPLRNGRLSSLNLKDVCHNIRFHVHLKTRSGQENSQIAAKQPPGYVMAEGVRTPPLFTTTAF